VTEPRELLDLMDQAIVVCDDALAELRFANQAARDFLASLGSAKTGLAFIGDAVLESGSPVAEGFGRAVERRVDGRRFFVRARRIPSANGGVMVIITEARLRRDDVIGVLHAQCGLSRRQCDLVMLVRDGQSSAEIAERLGLSEGTVRQYMSRIYESLGVGTRTRLIARVEELLQGQFGSRS
jgi:DNA-binding CsgD family transcriptional regulator